MVSVKLQLGVATVGPRTQVLVILGGRGGHEDDVDMRRWKPNFEFHNSKLHAVTLSEPHDPVSVAPFPGAPKPGGCSVNTVSDSGRTPRTGLETCVRAMALRSA